VKLLGELTGKLSQVPVLTTIGVPVAALGEPEIVGATVFTGSFETRRLLANTLVAIPESLAFLSAKATNNPF
jgi:hypothetical protein